MPASWMIVDVELVSGRGEFMEPRPGRQMLVGPTHTMEQFARAIDLAFARWDLSHLSMFALSGDRQVLDWEPDSDVGRPAFRAGIVTLADMDLGEGARFQYVFDMGDDWAHECVVTAVGVRPRDVYGATPRLPVAVWGWGSMPDQYGRLSRDGDELD